MSKIEKDYFVTTMEEAKRDPLTQMSTAYIVCSAMLALIELRESIDKHFNHLADMIEGLALAIADQADKLSSGDGNHSRRNPT